MADGAVSTCKPSRITPTGSCGLFPRSMPSLQALQESFKPSKRSQSLCLTSSPTTSSTCHLPCFQTGLWIPQSTFAGLLILFSCSSHATKNCPPFLELSSVLPSHLISTCVPTLRRPFLTSRLTPCSYSHRTYPLYNPFVWMPQGMDSRIMGHIKNDTTQH